MVSIIWCVGEGGEGVELDWGWGGGGCSRDGEGEEGMVCLQRILLNLLPPARSERNPNAEMVEVWGGWEMVCKIFLVLLVSL